MLATSHQASFPRSARRGFSLIEMVIVVGIIVLLFALTIGVLTVLNRGSETRRTDDSLMLLDSAYGEWKRQAERDLSYGIDGTPPNTQYEVQMDTTVDSPPGSNDDHEATDEVIKFIQRNAQSRDQLAKIHPDLLKQHSAANTEVTLVDAWGTEIVTVLPGRVWISGVDVAGAPVPPDQFATAGRQDIDGTIRTPFENTFGVCRDRRLRFVSAGPDGLFGDFNAASGSPLYEALRDNVYSYPLEVTP